MKKTIIGLCLLVTWLTVGAKEFPNRPVTLIVPYGAGGPTDVIARKIAVPLSRELKQSVVVENRVSAGGIVAMEAVLRANPDGYTIFINNNGMATLSGFATNLKFNPLQDFAPIGEINDAPMVLVGRKNLKPANFKELREYIVQNQRTINIASGGIGTTSHLCALALLEQLRVEAKIIPYKGVAPALIDLQGGQVDLLCDQITVTQGHIKAGRIKAYGVTSLKRNASLPDVATLHEQGLRGFKQQVWHALYTTKGTPATTVDRLNQALRNSLQDPEFQQNLKVLGATVVEPERMNPDRVIQDLQVEQARWQPLVLKDRVRNNYD